MTRQLLNDYATRMATMPAIVEGVVVNNNDPQQMGRVQVWCPGVDGEGTDYDALPWAKVTFPIAGQLHNFPAGSRGVKTKGLTSYGFWAIPQLNAIVDVMFLYNDPNRRRVIGCVYGDHGNRSLPVGRNRPDMGMEAPVSDTFEPMQPQTDNLKEQFGGKLSAPEAKTRGTYERQVAQDKDVRDGSEGYQKNPYGYGRELSPQTFCLTTPGRHAIIIQDNPETGRMRFKTADGHQIILDDANERIYISTCMGKSWVEMDRDGHIHVYGSESVSVSAGNDINLVAGKNVNISAGGSVNIASGTDTLITACGDFSSAGKNVFIESKCQLNLLAKDNIIQTGALIHLNGPNADASKCASSPSVIPNHEPWQRPASKSTRGPNWKP